MITKPTINKIYFAFTLVIIAAISAIVPYAQSSDGRTIGLQSTGKKAERLEGSWIITVTAVVPPGVPPPPVRTNYTTFARGGVSIGSDRLAPFANPQHGVWEHQGGNDFVWTFVGDNFDPAGNYLGTLKVRNKLTMSGPDQFVGVNNAELRDAAGNLVFSRCNTFRGERIQIEPLAEQCQSIPPPQ
jgi:hypothetical protein